MKRWNVPIERVIGGASEPGEEKKKKIKAKTVARGGRSKEILRRSSRKRNLWINAEKNKTPVPTEGLTERVGGGEKKRKKKETM